MSTEEHVVDRGHLSPTPALTWRKASYSTGNGACVEVAPVPGGVLVRHSKHPNGPTIHYRQVEWDAFVAGVKCGEFDQLFGAAAG